jgi:hypothetical protein
MAKLVFLAAAHSINPPVKPFGFSVRPVRTIEPFVPCLLMSLRKEIFLFRTPSHPRYDHILGSAASFATW